MSQIICLSCLEEGYIYLKKKKKKMWAEMEYDKPAEWGTENDN